MKVRVNAASFAEMIKLLADGAYTLQELATETGLHYKTVCEYVAAMHRKRVVHVSVYAPDARGRIICPVYQLGAGRDARRTPLTPAQRQAARRAKLRQLNTLRALCLGS